MKREQLLDRIEDGRTDLVWDYVASGHPATDATADGVKLVQWCAYYGDVGAIRFLIGHRESLFALGANLGLQAAAFHGHWRLCEFLLEQGADAGAPDAATGETPLHAALCTSDRSSHDLVLRVLLARGANPNVATKPGIETGSFMRDCRTRAETPLHRAAAFGSGETIDLLLAAGAKLDARDMNGDSPLSWASWHARPDSILRRLCFGPFQIHPDRVPMRTALLGRPHQKG